MSASPPRVSARDRERAPPRGPPVAVRSHLLTVGLEDYFQVGAFRRLIPKGQWYRFEGRVRTATERTLALLDEHRARATFFVLGWVADQVPELIREVAERGHEVASKGYYHRNVRELEPAEFREDLARAREAIEDATDRRVLGYRLADGWLGPRDLWVLDLLADEGYSFDSSFAPLLGTFRHEPWRRLPYRHQSGDRSLWVFPISSVGLRGWSLPIAGGNYLRQLPGWLVRPAVARRTRVTDAPLVMYFHTWELDRNQPAIRAAPWLQRVRQYRHLDRMDDILSHYLRTYRFQPIGEYLGLDSRLPARDRPEPVRGQATTASVAIATRTPVTIVVPCYNEELTLPYLANTLASVERTLGDRYELRYRFVNDGSTDGTGPVLERLFGGRPGTRVLHHPENRGVAAGLLTGIRDTDTEVVCSIDCDCSYDPHLLAEMIPLLEPGVDLVTASPYHPGGGVRNVPPWRLFLSRNASRLYRLVLAHQLHTYTSCFRVYRRSAVADLHPSRPGFLGVVEVLGRIHLAGGRIVEYPAVLESRLLGHSKMKVLRTMLGHFGLLAELALAQRTGRRRVPAATGGSR